MNFFFDHVLLWNQKYVLLVPFLAYVADVLFQDPRNIPHPVQGVGWLARWFERKSRGYPAHPFVAGIVCTLLTCGVCAGIVIYLIHLPFFIGSFFSLYFAWTGLALGGLIKEGKKALLLIDKAKKAVEAQENFSGQDIFPELIEARNSVAMLVSRDVQNLSVDDLYRTLAETLSENFTDGFIAPFFWLCLTGPVGLWFYKSISTLDSLWGYKTPEYLYFGRMAARCDDAFAFLPARFAAFMLYATSFWFRESYWPGWRVVTKEAHQLASPNAGWAMATVAWSHGCSMGGAASYHGKTIKKPVLGPTSAKWDSIHLKKLMQHLQHAGAFAAVVLVVISFFIFHFIAQ